MILSGLSKKKAGKSMAIEIKSSDQIAKIRTASKIVKDTHELLREKLKPGITTKQLDKIADEYIRSQGAVPSFKGYRGYKASICISINEVVIHGVPGSRRIRDGDLVSIDIGAFINGYHGDAARSHLIGSVSEEAKKLVSVTEKSFFEGIKFAKSGNHLYEISKAIGNYAESFGFSVVQDFVGHGIGRKMHESPEIPNFGQKKRGPKLYKGMALAIEPMINQGKHSVVILDDGWTVVTEDKKLSAHYENTVIITEGEPEILTL